MEAHHFNTVTETIFIKNMVSTSCIHLIRLIFINSGFINILQIELGEVKIAYDKQVINKQIIESMLKPYGFSLLAENNEILVQKIKIAVIQLIFYGNNTNTVLRNSDFLSQKFNKPYTYLSKLFSDYTGETLEKYIIHIKIEKVKELLEYNEMTVSEIAYQMGYSSVQYLSNQFKQITGISISDYRNQKIINRIAVK